MIEVFSDHEESMVPDGEEMLTTGETGESSLEPEAADDSTEESEVSMSDMAGEEEESSAPAVIPGIIKPEETDDDELAHEWYVVKVANGREDTLSRKVERKLVLVGYRKLLSFSHFRLTFF